MATLDAAIAGAPPRPGVLPPGPSAAWRRFARNRRNQIALAFLLPVLLLALTSPWLPMQGPLETNFADRLVSPSPSHPFGTDKLGRDIMSRTLAGLKLSLWIGFAAAMQALVAGVVIGTMAGFMGRGVDRAVSVVTDVMLSFPTLLLVIGVVAVTGPGVAQIIFAIAVADAPRAVRLQRSLAIGLRSRPYMDAARLASAPTWWILVRHVVPNTLAPMVVVATLYASNAIQAEAALSFLGLGIVPPAPSLGNLVADGRNLLQDAWWISTIPGLCIAMVAIGLHFLSDGIREFLDPRQAV